MRARQGLARAVPHLPSVAEIVEDFLHEGFVRPVYQTRTTSTTRSLTFPDDEARTILADPANWKPGNERLISLAPTDKGLALYRGEEVSTDKARAVAGQGRGDPGSVWWL